jgi:hypothetical protein
MGDEPRRPTRLTLLFVAVTRGKSLHAWSAFGLRMHQSCRDPAHRVRREEESGMPCSLCSIIDGLSGVEEPSIKTSSNCRKGWTLNMEKGGLGG